MLALAPPPRAIRFPRLLWGLVDAVMCGETLLRRPSASTGYPPGANASSNGIGVDNTDGESNTPEGMMGGARTPSGAAAGAKDTAVYPWRGGGGSWEDLAAPAARLWVACRPSSTAQLEALDEVLGDLFWHRAG